MFDLLIKHGTVIDGTRTPRYRADVGIRGDRIAQIGDLGDAEATTIIDATGQIVAPGFIDVHTHSDGWLLHEPNFFVKTSQGFTTEFLMADGISYAPVRGLAREWVYYLRSLNGLGFRSAFNFEDVGDYLSYLHQRTAQNVVAHIPYANLRALVAGFGRAIIDDYQMIQLQRLVNEGMAQGAVGLSTGLDYIAQCFATTDELVAACEAMSADGGVYVTHVRYKRGTLAGVQEAVEIGVRADVPVHISHLKGETPEDCEAILHYIDTVAVNQVDFSFDVYPYVSSSTMLNYLLPYEVWEDGPLGVINHLTRLSVRDQFNRTLESLPLDQIQIAWLPSKNNAALQGQSLAAVCANQHPGSVLSDLLIEEGLAVLLVFRHENDDLVDDFLRHDRFMLGSDGIYFTDGFVHPRVYGSAARILGPCVRDKHLFSLEDAVHKMTGFPAARFGLHGRGTLQAEHYADVVVFDADTIVDRTTYREPHQYSAGVEHVLVNGVPVVRGSAPVVLAKHDMPGRALRFRQG